MTETKQENLKTLADIDKVIHEPARLLILAYLSVVKNADFLFMMNQTGLTRGNLSSHMSKLEASGYVEIKKEFVDKIPRTLLSLTKEGKKAFKNYRKNMKQMLDSLPG
ncbi:MAG: transcriptional regulator [Candidatus Cloacimonetes bacterium]|jgi:DNA-binding MarR family transcriptional regulator|nr:transcriptional regulator [Candidatus Cloacimonadota bacterium]